MTVFSVLFCVVQVVIRGPKDDVESARKQLLDLVNEKVRALHSLCWAGNFLNRTLPRCKLCNLLLHLQSSKHFGF